MGWRQTSYQTERSFLVIIKWTVKSASWSVAVGFLISLIYSNRYEAVAMVAVAFNAIGLGDLAVVPFPDSAGWNGMFSRYGWELCDVSRALYLLGPDLRRDAVINWLMLILLSVFIALVVSYFLLYSPVINVKDKPEHKRGAVCGNQKDLLARLEREE